MDHEAHKEPIIIDIEGKQAFSADFSFEMLMAQGRRIDRAKNMARCALLLALAAMILTIALR